MRSFVFLPLGLLALTPVLAGSADLRLSFERNIGQTDSRVQFLSRGRAFTLFLTANEAVLAFDSVQPGVTLQMQLKGANPAARIIGADELPGRSNYFIGRDPVKWRTNITNYARVKYQGVYPGADLIYYGNQGSLEYDFVLAPGADPSAIQLHLSGARSVAIDRATGDLLLETSGGAVRFHKPVVYQPALGRRSRAVIDAGYTLDNGSNVRFRLGPYDNTKSLVIDPVLAYSTYLGGSSRDSGSGVTVDSSGNMYLAGTTRSADFPVLNPIEPFHGGTCGTLSCRDVFITKFNAAGSALIYSTFIGGANDDIANAVAIDGSLNVYVTGSTLSVDFPTTPGAFQTSYGGSGSFNTGDAFITKLNSTGSALVYSTYLGGNGDENAYTIAVDKSGNAYVPGFTTSSNFPGTAGAYQATCPSSPCYSGYVAKMNPTGSALVFATFLGSVTSTLNSCSGLAMDLSGNIYVSGITGAPDFPTTAGAYDTVCGTDGACNGTTDGFVSKLNSTGSGLIYSTFLGGSNFDNAFAVAVDKSGNAYITGSTVSSDFPVTTGALQPAYGGGSGCTTYNCGDAFVTKLNAKGSGLVYSSYLGGSLDDSAVRGIVDASGNFYVAGATDSTNFPVANAVQPLNAGSYDGFVSKVNPAGTAFAYSTYVGGSNADFVNNLGLDSSGNAYVTGNTLSTNFPVTPGAFQTQCGTDGTCNGGYVDAFLTKISLESDLAVTLSASPDPVASGSPLTYTITVANKGPDPVNTFKFHDAVPSGTTFKSVSVTSGSCKAPPVGGTGTVTCTANNLAASKSVTASLVVTVTAASGSTITDAASIVSSSSIDPNTANNSARVKVSVN